MNNNDVYPFAWGPKGKRVYGLKLGRRTQRISIIGALNRRKIIAPFVFEGHCDGEVFCTYLRKILVKELKPGQTIILDNASFHKSPEVAKIIKRAKCNILYLPAYSPDLNDIEKKWFPLKNKIRKKLQESNNDLMNIVEGIFKKKKT